MTHRREMTLAQLTTVTCRHYKQLPKRSLDRVPPVFIDRSTADAYYNYLASVPKFGQQLEALFVSWSWTAAGRFARSWSLPERGLSDLRWSRDLWQLSGGRRVALRAGSRLYGRRPEARFPSWLRNAVARETNAQRLFQRAVLHQPWREIAAAEQNRIHVTGAETKAVRRTVNAWAQRLGIRLPNVRAGRPRRTPQEPDT